MRTKRTFEMKRKVFFIIFEGLPLDQGKKTTRVTTRVKARHNTSTTRDKTTQHECNTSTARPTTRQHETTQEQYDTTRVKHDPRRVQRKLGQQK